MLIVLQNLAELPDLRPKLLTEEILTDLTDLLGNYSHDMPVLYNTTSILVHLANDSKDHHFKGDHTRQEILNVIDSTVKTWDLESDTQTGQESFESLLRLIQTSNNHQCQHWAIWSIAYFILKDSDQYCKILIQERGIFVLGSFISRNSNKVKYQEIIKLASMVKENAIEWRKHHNN